VTPEFLKMLESGTEHYRSENFEDVPPVSSEELQTWMGIQLLTGIVELPELNMYWDTKWGVGVDLVKTSCLSRNRFYQISRVFHLDEGVGSQTSKKFIKLQNLLLTRFQECIKPSKELSLDEAMVHFEGRSSVKVLMPDKPIPEGFKFYCVCEAQSGYLLNCFLCETPSTVERICSDLLEPFFGQGHHVYLDNFYSTVGVFESLLGQGIYCTGTFKKNRLPQPLKSLWNKQSMRKWERGNVEWSVHGHILFSAMKDNKAFIVGSTTATTQSFTNWTRKLKGGGKVQFNPPTTVSNYVQFLRGVDILDQRRSYYSAETRKNKKGWKKIFLFLLDAAIINSWILSQTTKRLLDYRMALIRKLISSKPTFPSRLLTTHFLFDTPSEGKKKKRRVCKLCSQVRGQKKQVTYECRKCDLGFHIKCFQLWHSCEDVNSLTGNDLDDK